MRVSLDIALLHCLHTDLMRQAGTVSEVGAMNLVAPLALRKAYTIERSLLVYREVSTRRTTDLTSAPMRAFPFEQETLAFPAA